MEINHRPNGRPIGCCYFDKSTRGFAGKHRPKNRWRADIVVNRQRFRQYVPNYQVGMDWCKKRYAECKKQLEE
jgi:hypothetical protein